MPLFKSEGDALIEIKEENFDLEKNLQKITEKNLELIFGLKLIKGASNGGEFSLNGFRIDTLAFDKESKSFIIIEYKKDKNLSVIDQGYAYLSLLLNNKAEFILEYNENSEDKLKREDVDWTQSKVVFVSPNFTRYQKQAINFKDLPIELYEVKRFSGEIILYEQLKSPETSESINKISQKSEVVQDVNKEVKVYSEEDHFGRASERTLQIYHEIKEKVLELGDDIIVKPRKWYIGFKRNTNFVDFELQKKQIKLFLNLKSGELNDPEGVAKDQTKPEPKGHWGNGDYEIVIENIYNLSYILSLIKQSYERN